MITFETARSILGELALSRLKSLEVVLLQDSLGRILGETLHAKDRVPSFDNSAMDGFALNCELAKDAKNESPISLPVTSIVYAGDGKGTYKKGSALEIMTGAPLPEGEWNAIVKIEDVEVNRDFGNATEIKIFRPIRRGDHIRRAGEDFDLGQEVLPKGTRITPEHILSLAALGISEVSVVQKPRVAVISTGNELVHYSEKTLGPGKIRNSTGPYLMSLLPTFGVDSKFFGVIEDDQSEFEAKVEKILKEGFDIILSTGAISMGQKDFIPDSLRKMGKIHFQKVSIRPGKPILCAELGNSIFIGLPGNPVSTAVGARFFVHHYLRCLQGLATEKPLQSALGERVTKPEGFRCFYKGKVYQEGALFKVDVLPGQDSFMVSPLLKSNCWVVLGEEGSRVEASELVDVYPMNFGI